jgi:hypothetical protein
VVFSVAHLGNNAKWTMAHELLHLYGDTHPEEGDEDYEEGMETFNAKVRECSGLEGY